MTRSKQYLHTVFIKAFLEIAKTWKQLTLSSTVEGMSKDE